MLTLWWLWMRLRWALSPLPRTLAKRDQVLADRAALVMDRHLRTIPKPEVGHAYSLDPYRATGPKVVAATPAIESVILTAIDRTKAVLLRHSLPQHLISALLRDRDPELVAHSAKVEADVKAEAAKEKAERALRTPMAPPPMPSSPPSKLDLRVRQEPPPAPPRPGPEAIDVEVITPTTRTLSGGGSKGTP